MMDPNATLQAVFEARNAKDWDTAIDRIDDLYIWIGNDGALPDLWIDLTYSEAMLRCRAMRGDFLGKMSNR